MNVRIFSILIVLLVLVSCKDASKFVKSKLGISTRNLAVDTVLYSKTTNIMFKDTLIDIGDVKEGVECPIVFHYQNKGAVPLMIFAVSPSCGCTVAEFSEDPLMPNGRDSIIAIFDSKNKSGSYQKNIKVNCNTDQKVHDLNFKVNVTK